MVEKRNVDILIIRPLLILSIIIGHTFAIFSGDWELPACCSIICDYKWINPLFISFQLQCFVFISGFLYGFKHYDLSLNQFFLRRKFLRLLVPTFFWGIVYLIVFYSDYKGLGLFPLFLKVLTGIGHLWFLPMLYGCFVIAYLVDLWKISLKYFILGSLVLCFLSIPIYYIGVVLHYCFFFVWGIVSYKYQSIFRRKIDFTKVGVLLLFFTFFFIAYCKVESALFLQKEEHYLIKMSYYLLKNGLEWIMSVSGILFLFGITTLFTKRLLNIPTILLLINTYCYPLFIYHQFILRYYFFRTDIFCMLPSSIVPWIGLVLGLSISVVLSYISVRFRLGRFLLGC